MGMVKNLQQYREPIIWGLLLQSYRETGMEGHKLSPHVVGFLRLNIYDNTNTKR